MLRAVGASVLAKIVPDDAEMILPVLIEALGSDDEEQRCYGELGANASVLVLCQQFPSYLESSRMEWLIQNNALAQRRYGPWRDRII